MFDLNKAINSGHLVRFFGIIVVVYIFFNCKLCCVLMQENARCYS